MLYQIIQLPKWYNKILFGQPLKEDSAASKINLTNSSISLYWILILFLQVKHRFDTDLQHSWIKWRKEGDWWKMYVPNGTWLGGNK